MTANNPYGSSVNHHILSVLVQNRPGVLARVASLFARRGYNIFSLAVAPAEMRHQVVELINIFEGKIVAVAPEVVTLSLEGHPDKLDDFEELLTGYGIVELQRSGRVALPRLERLRAVPSSNTKGRVG